MAAGRIPILVDTELVLPCTDVIDWMSAAVWVPLDGIDHVDRFVADFHRRLGPRGFIRRQKANRAVYENFLAPRGFARYLVDRGFRGEHSRRR